LPPRLERRSIDFGTLSDKSITDYIQALISVAYGAAKPTSGAGIPASAGAGSSAIARDIDLADLDDGFGDVPDTLEHVRMRGLDSAREGALKRALQTAHGFVRRQLGESAVSQRDLHRFFKLWRFLLWHASSRAARALNQDRGRASDRQFLIFRSALLAIGIVYFLRLDPSQRATLDTEVAKVAPRLSHSEPLPSVCKELAREADAYMKAIPEGATLGVTRNAALKENVFAITVCIQVGGCHWECEWGARSGQRSGYR
jgi:hypothetical protein